MIRTFRALMVVLLVSSLHSIAQGASDRSNPNVVFILADDLGAHDLGCYGSTFYETPNIDRLAKEGTKFTQFYTASPVCSPTRASMLTGKYPSRTNITNYIGAPSRPGQWQANTRLLPAPYQLYLDLKEVTIAEVLKKAGYATFAAGKWHLGSGGYLPGDQGFDIDMTGAATYFPPYHARNLPDGPPGEYVADRLAAETVKFIHANKERPFFAYLPLISVHIPLMSKPELTAKYKAKRDRLHLESKWGREGESTVRLSQDDAVYAGMVEAMDAAVGTVLNALDDLQLRDNTLVIFTSDNGGLSTAEGWPTSNLPLRAGKGWLYEGGIRAPLIIRGPLWAAKQSDAPAISMDLFSTILSAAGASAPAGRVDGLDLRGVVAQGTHANQRTFFFHYPHYSNQGGPPGFAVRRGMWKLIHWYDGDRFELFDLSRDPSEQSDLSAMQPKVLDEMKQELTRLRQETNSIAPQSNPAFDPQKPGLPIEHPPRQHDHH